MQALLFERFDVRRTADILSREYDQIVSAFEQQPPPAAVPSEDQAF